MKRKVVFLITFSLLVFSLVQLWFLEDRNESVEIPAGERSISVFSRQMKGEKYLFLPGFLSESGEIDTSKCRVEYGSEQVRSLFVSTGTGSMNEVYKNKEHKEQAKFVMLSGSGEVEWDNLNGTIKGHGNSTWLEEKKPFTIRFDEEIALAGHKSDKWVLLANAFDNTNIKNAMVYSVARELGMEHAVDCFFVDLYLNGSYNGLYLMVNAPGQFATEDTVLCNAALFDENLLTVGNSKIEVNYPAKATDERLTEIKSFLENVNGIIVNHEDISSVLDIDSWVKKYLIDEVFENYDAGLASSYFYWQTNDSDNRIIYGGPVWDYDISIYTNAETRRTILNPKILYAANEQRSSGQYLLWYKDLYDNDIFYNHMRQVYAEEFKPILQGWLESEMECLVDCISASVDCDRLRWEKNGTKDEISEVKNWLESRMGFLDGLWLENAEYHSVRIEEGEGSNYIRFFVKDGDSLLQDESYDLFFEENDIFRDEAGNQFTPDTAVHGNLRLSLQKSGVTSVKEKLLYNSDLLVVCFSVAVVGMAVLFFVVKWVKAGRSGKEEK